jgi:hypothetical protein
MKAATVVGTLLALLMVAPLKLQACQVPRSRRARQAIEDATLEAAFQDATSTRLSGGIALPSLLMKLNVMLHGWLDELSPRASTALVIGTGALIGALLDIIGAHRVAASLQYRGSSHVEAPSDTVPKGVQGTWHIDVVKSESMTPFLISVGAPRIIARMVGTRGKPVVIHVDGTEGVTVCVEGKADERFVTGLPTAVETPGGTVSATLTLGKTSDGLRSFTVHKAGPTAGEHTVEERVLTERGELECTFTHHQASGPEVRVVRVYTRHGA